MEVKDQIYSFEIARRSVGRAALHLGITTMSESALDVLADVLLQYLSRTGKAMAHLVESSGRPSSHVNILDAFQACHAVASPAVQRLHLAPDVEDPQQMMLMGASSSAAAAVAKSGSGTTGAAASAAAAAAAASTSNPGGSNNNNYNPNGKSGGGSSASSGKASGTAVFGQDSSTDWKGLAAFCFGPKWLEEKDDNDIPLTHDVDTSSRMDIDGEDHENGDANGEAVARPGAGKVGPSATTGEPVDGDTDRIGRLNSDRQGNKGWVAPYLDDVKAFPKASKKCANPHALPARVRLSLHYRKTDFDAEEAEEEEEAAQAELDEMPDDVFVSTNLKASSIEADEATGGTWGRMNKRKADEDVNDEDTAPPTKRVRLNEENALKRVNVGVTSAADTGAEEEADDAAPTMPTEFAFVPSFYPLPPSTKEVVDLGRTVVDLQEEQQKLLLQQQQNIYPAASSSAVTVVGHEESQEVRSSLVHLGQFYWGSGWDATNTSDGVRKEVIVPMGRPPSAGEGASARPEEPITPMSRASQSRVSRILEGSLDAAAMQ
ncbi:hypothetical protein IV203_025870 [Nitzschia inconspicua]|uniref:Bromodomain associated domain-containing protein n=1 Tax=Nitzschia inconspicua TaxID=303405 RepID=A0A9K3PYW2_9STRA|nr:hypothetical protein IV203_025870 [Nitzschia inconspicua]